jgi:hypothetical protein
MLQQAVEEIRAEAAADPQVTDRLEGLDSLLEQMAGWYDQVKRLPKPVLRTLVKMGGKIGMLAKKEVA